jgi:glycosyltransferase involved in cell wall biosynthesis
MDRLGDRPLHVFVDLTAADARACSEAMAAAGADRAPLLIVAGPLDVGPEAVLVMRQCLAGDPMLGAAIARTRCDSGCCLRTLPRNGLEAGGWMPRQTWAETSDTEIVPEYFDSNLLLLMAPDIVTEFGGLDDRFSTLPGALAYYLSRARRCGYRTIVANRAVAGLRGTKCAGENGTEPVDPRVEADRAVLRNLVPELERGWEESRAGSQARFETLHAHAAWTTQRAGRPSLLLDIRNVSAVHNGTSQAVLGCVRALKALEPRWDVGVLANPAAMTFHGLQRLCGRWPLFTEVPDRPFMAGLRLSQPWDIQEMIDLHHAALFNAYFMLDTIAWDIVYAAPRRQDGIWAFAADHADGFLFDSAFTEERFLARFERARTAARAVCHYPFDPADYRRADAARTAQSDYLLVVGNEFDHKDVRRTVRLIAEAFPFQPIVAFGGDRDAWPNVRVVYAGSLPEAEVHRLYAGAACIVFPSFYEGFGFPVVTALAYGKTLVARESALLREIADRCALGRGRLVTFGQRHELVGIIGALLHGDTVPHEPIGNALSGEPRNWRDVARDIIAFLDDLVRAPQRSRWQAREHAVMQMLAFVREPRVEP